jgi:two-component system, OmpR family, response regulator
MATTELKRIMYIEDEPDIIAIAEIALKDIGGLEVKCCHSGQEALNEAKIFQPDLFLIDVMMPEMDGPTVLSQLRSIPDFAKTPVIFMTAKAQPSEVKEYINLGAVDVITKPFDPMKLADNIRKIWNAKNE